MSEEPAAELPSFLKWPGWTAVLGTGGTIGMVVFLIGVVHLNPVASLGAAFGAGILARAAADMWPRKVPAELAATVGRLERSGWRRTRYHPFLCTEKLPHAHLTRQDSGSLRQVKLTAVDHGESEALPPFPVG